MGPPPPRLSSRVARTCATRLRGRWAHRHLAPGHRGRRRRRHAPGVRHRGRTPAVRGSGRRRTRGRPQRGCGAPGPPTRPVSRRPGAAAGRAPAHDHLRAGGRSASAAGRDASARPSRAAAHAPRDTARRSRARRRPPPWIRIGARPRAPRRAPPPRSAPSTSRKRPDDGGGRPNGEHEVVLRFGPIASSCSTRRRVGVRTCRTAASEATTRAAGARRQGRERSVDAGSGLARPAALPGTPHWLTLEGAGAQIILKGMARRRARHLDDRGAHTGQGRARQREVAPLGAQPSRRVSRRRFLLRDGDARVVIRQHRSRRSDAGFAVDASRCRIVATSSAGERFLEDDVTAGRPGRLGLIGRDASRHDRQGGWPSGRGRARHKSQPSPSGISIPSPRTRDRAVRRDAMPRSPNGLPCRQAGEAEDFCKDERTSGSSSTTSQPGCHVTSQATTPPPTRPVWRAR